MNKLERIKSRILSDHEKNNYKDGHFPLTDIDDIANYADYKKAVKELNDDTKFPYTVYIQLFTNSIKIQYQPLNSKFYEYKQPSEVIAVLERLTNHVKRLNKEKNISHSTYVKDGSDGLNIIIEGINGTEVLTIDITNTFKFND